MKMTRAERAIVCQVLAERRMGINKIKEAAAQCAANPELELHKAFPVSTQGKTMREVIRDRLLMQAVCYHFGGGGPFKHGEGRDAMHSKGLEAALFLDLAVHIIEAGDDDFDGTGERFA